MVEMRSMISNLQLKLLDLACRAQPLKATTRPFRSHSALLGLQLHHQLQDCSVATLPHLPCIPSNAAFYWIWVTLCTWTSWKGEGCGMQSRLCFGSWTSMEPTLQCTWRAIDRWWSCTAKTISILFVSVKETGREWQSWISEWGALFVLVTREKRQAAIRQCRPMIKFGSQSVRKFPKRTCTACKQDVHVKVRIGLGTWVSIWSCRNRPNYGVVPAVFL